MRNKKKLVLLFAVSTLFFFCIGCIGGMPGPFRSNVAVQTKSRGWTDRQSEAAKGRAYLYFLDTHNDPLDDIDTKTVLPLPAIKFELFSLEGIIARIDNWLSDYNDLLGYKLEEYVKYVNLFGLRPALTHDEKVMKTISARVRTAFLYNKFRKMLKNEFMVSTDESDENWYDIGKIFGSVSPYILYPFNIERINNARKSNNLKKIKSCNIKIGADVDLELSSYNVVYEASSKDDVGPYIEGYRIRNGRKEGHPCLKVFTSIREGEYHSVMVIDTKREGDPGFGLPDIIEDRNLIVGMEDILQDRKLIDTLFVIPKKNERTPPKISPVYVEMAGTEHYVDVWEKTKDAIHGYKLTFNYKNQDESNYNVRFEVSESKIKYIKKEWTNGSRLDASYSRVVEYFKPKYPYDELLLQAIRFNLPTGPQHVQAFLFIGKDGSSEFVPITPGINKYIQDQPSIICYSVGNQRYAIKKSHGSLIFDKKREIPLSPLEQTGAY